jgi:hypothetical protein
VINCDVTPMPARAYGERHHRAVAKWKHFCNWPDFTTARYSSHCAHFQMAATRDAGGLERTPMNWADTLKATALATSAERATPAAPIPVGLWNWDAHDVWLTRARQPRASASRPSPSDTPTESQPRFTLRD